MIYPKSHMPVKVFETRGAADVWRLYQLEWGFATIPLPGIDVPFHSQCLWAGVCHSVHVCVMFACLMLRSWISVDLSKKIHAAQLNPDMLVGKYIPNLVATDLQGNLSLDCDGSGSAECGWTSTGSQKPGERCKENLYTNYVIKNIFILTKLIVVSQFILKSEWMNQKV